MSYSYIERTIRIYGLKIILDQRSLINKTIIKYGINYYGAFLLTNLETLRIFFHEIEHVKQLKKAFEKCDDIESYLCKMVSLPTVIYNDSKILYKLKYKSLQKINDFYYENYGIAPIERMAELEATKK